MGISELLEARWWPRPWSRSCGGGIWSSINQRCPKSLARTSKVELSADAERPPVRPLIRISA
jgi:hypothetical protein